MPRTVIRLTHLTLLPALLLVVLLASPNVASPAQAAELTPNTAMAIDAPDVSNAIDPGIASWYGPGYCYATGLCGYYPYSYYSWYYPYAYYPYAYWWGPYFAYYPYPYYGYWLY